MTGKINYKLLLTYDKWHAPEKPDTLFMYILYTRFISTSYHNSIWLKTWYCQCRNYCDL